MTYGQDLVTRTAGRVLLLDGADRVLLFEGAEPGATASWWFTVGGGAEPGEGIRAAAVREMWEETGLVAEEEHLVGPVWRRRAHFTFDGRRYDQQESFFVLRVDHHEVDCSGFEALEVACVRSHRWWTTEELRGTGAVVYPRGLADLLAPLLRGPWSGSVLDLGIEAD